MRSCLAGGFRSATVTSLLTPPWVQTEQVQTATSYRSRSAIAGSTVTCCIQQRLLMRSIEQSISQKKPGAMPERRDERVRLRGGPGWDYPCDNSFVTECAMWECQKARRCRMKDYFGREGNPSTDIKTPTAGTNNDAA